MSEPVISELFATIAEWAVAKGAANLPASPGLWTADCGEFSVAINCHDVEHKTGAGLTVPPMHAVVHAPKYAFAVLMVNPYGGIAPPGMEDDVLAALKVDIAAMAPP